MHLNREVLGEHCSRVARVRKLTGFNMRLLHLQKGSNDMIVCDSK